MSDQRRQEMQKKLHEIFPNIEPLDNSVDFKRSRRKTAVAQRAHDELLAKPRGGVSLKRWQIELARLKDEALKPCCAEIPPKTNTSVSSRPFFRASSRSGPLHSPDPIRLKAVIAKRETLQERLVKQTINKPDLISSELHSLRKMNVGAGACRYKELVKHQDLNGFCK